MGTFLSPNPQRSEKAFCQQAGACKHGNLPATALGEKRSKGTFLPAHPTAEWSMGTFLSAVPRRIAG